MQSNGRAFLHYFPNCSPIHGISLSSATLKNSREVLIRLNMDKNGLQIFFPNAKTGGMRLPKCEFLLKKLISNLIGFRLKHAMELNCRKKILLTYECSRIKIY